MWARYGHHKSFQGWYLSQEISRRTKNMSRIYAEVGRHAKAVSGGLKTMISPYILSLIHILCTFNNAKYAAIYEGAHFTYGEFKAYMFDVTTPDQMTGACDTSPSKVFVSNEYKPAGAVVNAAGDVLMTASADGYKMNLYYTDANTNALVAWEFDCIDK